MKEITDYLDQALIFGATAVAFKSLGANGYYLGRGIATLSTGPAFLFGAAIYTVSALFNHIFNNPPPPQQPSPLKDFAITVITGVVGNLLLGGFVLSSAVTGGSVAVVGFGAIKVAEYAIAHFSDHLFWAIYYGDHIFGLALISNIASIFLKCLTELSNAIYPDLHRQNYLVAYLKTKNFSDCLSPDRSFWRYGDWIEAPNINGLIENCPKILEHARFSTYHLSLDHLAWLICSTPPEHLPNFMKDHLNDQEKAIQLIIGSFERTYSNKGVVIKHIDDSLKTPAFFKALFEAIVNSDSKNDIYSNTKFSLLCLEILPEAFKYVSSHLKQKEEFIKKICLAFNEKPKALSTLIKIQPDVYQYIDPKHKENESFMLGLLKENTNLWEYVDDSHKNIQFLTLVFNEPLFTRSDFKTTLSPRSQLVREIVKEKPTLLFNYIKTLDLQDEKWSYFKNLTENQNDILALAEINPKILLQIDDNVLQDDVFIEKLFLAAKNSKKHECFLWNDNPIFIKLINAHSPNVGDFFERAYERFVGNDETRKNLFEAISKTENGEEKILDILKCADKYRNYDSKSVYYAALPDSLKKNDFFSFKVFATFKNEWRDLPGACKTPRFAIYLINQYPELIFDKHYDVYNYDYYNADGFAIDVFLETLRMTESEQAAFFFYLIEKNPVEFFRLLSLIKKQGYWKKEDKRVSNYNYSRRNFDKKIKQNWQQGNLPEIDSEKFELWKKSKESFYQNICGQFKREHIPVFSLVSKNEEQQKKEIRKLEIKQHVKELCATKNLDEPTLEMNLSALCFAAQEGDLFLTFPDFLKDSRVRHELYDGSKYQENEEFHLQLMRKDPSLWRYIYSKMKTPRIAAEVLIHGRYLDLYKNHEYTGFGSETETVRTILLETPKLSEGEQIVLCSKLLDGRSAEILIEAIGDLIEKNEIKAVDQFAFDQWKLEKKHFYDNFFSQKRNRFWEIKAENFHCYNQKAQLQDLAYLFYGFTQAQQFYHSISISILQLIHSRYFNQPLKRMFDINIFKLYNNWKDVDASARDDFIYSYLLKFPIDENRICKDNEIIQNLTMKPENNIWFGAACMFMDNSGWYMSGKKLVISKEKESKNSDSLLGCISFMRKDEESMRELIKEDLYRLQYIDDEIKEKFPTDFVSRIKESKIRPKLKAVLMTFLLIKRSLALQTESMTQTLKVIKTVPTNIWLQIFWNTIKYS